MAKLVKVGQPVNDAEKWAFDFLSKELPDNYIIITNVDVYSDHGQPFECDAIIIGDWAVYIIDVKGYKGRLNAGKDVWQHESKIVENPLSKLHQNARILASRCKVKLRQNQHAPWCQGMAFITGGVGGEVIVAKGEDKLPVYHKNNILQALTSPDYVTSYHKYKLDDQQKDIALSAICDFKLLQEKGDKVGNYIKKKLLSSNEDVELWIVEPDGYTFNFQYWMKYADITGKSSARATELKDQFKKEFYLLSELSDLPSVPAALSIYDDGESLALVHQNIIGEPLTSATDYDLKSVMLNVAETLIEMSERGIHHRAISLENIFISKDGKVQLLDVGLAKSRETQTLVSAHQLENPWLPPEYIEHGVYNSASLSYQFALTFLPLVSSKLPNATSTLEFISEDFILEKNLFNEDFIDTYGWFNNAINITEIDRPNLFEFIDSFSDSLGDIDELQSDFKFLPGVVINEKYELIDCIGRGGTSSIWTAKHLLGEYTCCLKVLDTFDGAEDLARKEFEILRVLYHPNIVRIFDLDIIPNSNQYFLTCEYLEGDTLDQVDFSSISEALDYFRQTLSALQYLHRLGRIHKDVKPENIVISAGKASLIDFNLSMLDSRFIGTTRFKDPRVKYAGWSKISDIYSLVISFCLVLAHKHPFIDNDEIPNVDVIPNIPMGNEFLPSFLRSKFVQVLNREVDWGCIQDYSAWFGITNTADIIIPDCFLEKWKVNKGYMLKVLKSMLTDMQPRSRKVVIQNTLKVNDIVGNKSNKGSVSAAISSLKSAEVLEVSGKKIKLTEKFINEWNILQKQ